jgi:hypothetical protein
MMTGLIWTIQILHYPTFKYISESQFQDFHNFHTKNITFIVLPVMAFELFTGIALAVLFPDSHLLWINLFCLLLIWIGTFFVSVPVHGLLAKGWNARAIERLILTNWVRTSLWSFRLFVLFYLFLTIFEVSHGNFGNSANLKHKIQVEINEQAFKSSWQGLDGSTKGWK